MTAEDATAGKEGDGIRVLFAFGVSQTFFELPSNELPRVFETLVEAFRGLESRFGVRVLGTLDDDATMVGPSTTWPWTCYILAEAPDREAAVAVCDLLRQTPVGEDRLWKYLQVEARIGRPLFFGES